jgi:predicted TIM-barrel fold metal-dependent hydrolase
VTAPVIDVHVHLSESKALGAWSKAAYEIWEYGRYDNVRFGPASGDLGEFREAMRAGGLDHAVVVNAFSVDEWRGRWLAGLDDHEQVAGRSLGTRLLEFNEWLVGSVAAVPEITPFVAVDPWVLSLEDLAAHLEAMRERGALGIKLHPIDQRFVVSDEHMVRIGRLCAELDLIVLSHSGTSRGDVQFADPEAFARLAGAVPGLRLVLAHLGGGSWRQIDSLASRFPDIAFDLSEIVAWLGAPFAPSEEDLVALVHDNGPERVMFGSDFPWYDPGEMIKIVRSLPGFTDDELAGILGGNAARILRLPV